ncbi:homoserine dehydrogenase [Azorhizobium caulinodans ORS 571]|uniref:Homoserine dehydrogenase n=1 Tax=Azorhizobium caulinodans (strain ATCC 43989 / DSM 5975 / JCM 20966 / LMG 6465 / NBRC 14845 / NCIMB 13405 / ORS 571) TaxID=438753 RepID=A8I2B9_AZOC5|nr:homoserine dehydrogenase [Azorhizobium caulinodans]BAF87846.1 homoserine dehydrogenase [Azorhizobium caulinodans ORS 571]
MSQLKIGLAGLGTVGAAVVGMLERRAGEIAARTGRTVKVVAVSARSKSKDRGVDLSAVRWYDDPVELARDPDIDVFVELMGGEGDPARAAVTAALQAGRAVVTANKALLARHGLELAKIAEASGGSLHFEAAVAGGIPIVKTLREALGGNRIGRVSGILNGTCNYILTRMADEKLAFDTCLSEAQRLGYAEADPTFDIDGHDTAHKLALLTSLAFGTQVDADSIYVEGIRSLTLADLEAADELGFNVKLLGVAVRTDEGIEQRVHPTMVPKGWPIAQVSGVTNAVAVDGDAVNLTLVGPGAGGAATASAVVGDLIDVAKGNRGFAFGLPVSALEPCERAPMQRHGGGYYIRLAAVNKPGTAATIAGRMAEEGISLASIVQRQPARAAGAKTVGPEDVAVILITYATTEDAVRKAIDAIEADGVIVGRPQVIRIEKD